MQPHGAKCCLRIWLEDMFWTGLHSISMTPDYVGISSKFSNWWVFVKCEPKSLNLFNTQVTQYELNYYYY